MSNSPTKLQDCNIIADAFERGIHFDSSEASVYAPLTRRIQNTKLLVNSVKGTLNSYKTQPVANVNQGTTESISKDLTGLKIQNQFVTVPVSQQSSSILSRAVKECIPCLSRPIHNLDLNVSSNLLNALKLDLERRLRVLNEIQDLFSNFNFYGDYCQIVEALNSMCVPDLQRILLILASLITNLGSDLGRITSLLQALIIPFFSPVLFSINSLLDKLIQLVLNPLNCIITSIQQNIRKLDIGALVGDATLTSVRNNVNDAGTQVNVELRQFQGKTRSALIELHSILNQGNNLLRNKVLFYSNQLQKLLGEWIGHDLRYNALAGQKLVIVRLISLVRAIIKARGQGHICENKKPGKAELDLLFSTFLSPTSPFNISIDDNGNLRLEEKAVKPNSTTIEGKPLLIPPTQPLTVVIKCSMNTSQNDIEKVNKWMSELDNFNEGTK